MQVLQEQRGPESTPKPAMARKRGPPPALRIDTPAQNEPVQASFALTDSSAPNSTMSSATSETCDSLPFNPGPNPNKPKALRNMKRLSLTLPSAQSSTSSLAIPTPEGQQVIDPPLTGRLRRPSVASLPVLHRREEDGGSPTAPYVDGPIQIIPGIWLGSEDNAKDWSGLMERGIKSILNVAKEVASPFDTASAQPRRPFASTPNLSETIDPSRSTYYPPHVPSGRPGMHYLKMHWSHGQSDLIQEGFPAAMQFVDQALDRNEGVLIQYVLYMFIPCCVSPRFQLPMWHLAIGHHGYRSCYACRRHLLLSCSPRSLGSERLSCCI
jgi:tyrosine-protein phosphatase MSG5